MVRTRRIVSIRRSMLNNIMGLVIGCGLAILIATVVAANQFAKTLAEVLIAQTIQRSESEVNHFIDPVHRALRLTGHWIGQSGFSADQDSAQNHFIPLLSEHPSLDAVLLLDPDQNLMMLRRNQQGWLLRLLAANDNGQARSLLINGDDTSTWYRERYAIELAKRPWFAQAKAAAPGQINWTDAYIFFSNNRPGITAAAKIIDGGGGEWIIAFDVLLESISEFSRNFAGGYDSLVILTDGRGQIVGLPNLPRFASPQQRQDAYFKHPSELDFSLANDAAKAFQPDRASAVATEPVRFRSDGQAWWGQGQWISLDPSHYLWVGVLIPEVRLLGAIHQLRIVIVAVILGVTLLAMLRAAALARRYSEPISQLAAQSLRISQGNLESQARVRSPLRELRSLARAHERMRTGLTQLLKLNDDMQLARQIQQKTFPNQFPSSRHIDVAAGSRPADATGGDTYDVIGLCHGIDCQQVRTREPDRMLAFLADATGHGIAAALTATQVHAMFRIAARLGQPIQQIMTQMNEQLYEDAHGGRFVTAWLCDVMPKQGRVSMLSAGQAPILVYRLKDQAFEQYAAHCPPLGISTDTDLPEPQDLCLARGDILAVLSDGVTEARDPSGQRFGLQRTQDIIAANAKRPATEIIELLADAVNRFLDGQPRHDDQTGIIIRRR